MSRDPWVHSWTTEAGSVNPVLIDWMRSRPLEIQTLLRAFPPGCVVRGTRTLVCPAPGRLAVVHSYSDTVDQGPRVTVLDHPVGAVKFWCDPDWIEPVGFRHGLTPTVVAYLLDAPAAEIHQIKKGLALPEGWTHLINRLDPPLPKGPSHGEHE